MRLLVIGGCGFIGSHLVEELLQRGNEVTVVGCHCHLGNLKAVKGMFGSIRGDITDKNFVDSLTDAHVEGILHLAALINVDQSIQSPELFLNTNVMAAVTIMEAARRKNINKLLYMSTCEVYGNIPRGKAGESHPTDPRSPYAASKLAAERYLLAHSYTYAKPKIVIIRGFNQYGPRQNAGRGGAVIPRSIIRLLDDQKIQVHGNGNQTRDYVYVKDTVRGIADAFGANLANGEVINLATGVETSIRDIAISTCKLAGKDPQKYIEFVKDRPGQLMRSCGDYTKARRLLDWQPTVPFRKGLSLTFEWYAKRHRNKIS